MLKAMSWPESQPITRQRERSSLLLVLPQALQAMKQRKKRRRRTPTD